ncbi:MAG: hypothetical protein DRJ97_05020 [Thermoprotei archaeon]|nr:MAG: hypothetical protein DRJ97_05020 [Thermoprotei archaeon]
MSSRLNSESSAFIWGFIAFYIIVLLLFELKVEAYPMIERATYTYMLCLGRHEALTYLTLVSLPVYFHLLRKALREVDVKLLLLLLFLWSLHVYGSLGTYDALTLLTLCLFVLVIPSLIVNARWGVLGFIGGFALLELVGFVGWLPGRLSLRATFLAPLIFNVYLLSYVWSRPAFIVAMLCLYVFPLGLVIRGWFKEFSFRESWCQLLALLSIILSIYLTAYLYFPWVNPEEVAVGADVTPYVEMLGRYQGRLREAFLDPWSRPLLLLLLEAFRSCLRLEAVDAVKYFPFVLNPLFTLSCYLVVKEAFGDEGLAGLAAFFGATGPQFIVGAYSLFLANLLALTEVNMSLALLFRGLRRGRPVLGLGAGLVLILTSLTHPWTLAYYGACLLILPLTLIRRRRLAELKVAICSLLPLLASFFVEVWLRGSSFILALYGWSLRQLSFSQLGYLWGDIIFTFNVLYGGCLSNLVLWSLGLIGVVAVSSKVGGHVPSNLLALTCLVTAVAPPFVRGYVGLYTYSRFLYVFPLYIFAAVGFSELYKRLDGWFERFLLTLFVASFILNYDLGRLANMVV